MSDFGFIRTVNKCCLCIGLKTGSLIIAILAILDLSDICITSYQPICSKPSHIASILESLINWLSVVANIVMFITAIAFIYGIIKSVKKTAEWFMYAILFALIVRVLYIIVLVVLGLLFPGCKIFSIHIINKIIGILVWSYFLSVVKSYAQEM